MPATWPAAWAWACSFWRPDNPPPPPPPPPPPSGARTLEGGAAASLLTDPEPLLLLCFETFFATVATAAAFWARWTVLPPTPAMLATDRAAFARERPFSPSSEFILALAFAAAAFNIAAMTSAANITRTTTNACVLVARGLTRGRGGGGGGGGGSAAACHVASASDAKNVQV